MATAPEAARATDLNVELGGIGFDMELDVPRSLLYVSVPTFNEVVLISTENFQIVDRVVVGSRPQGIDLSHDGRRLFVALNQAAAVAVLDLETLAVSEIEVIAGTDHSLVYDVIEGQPGRLFATANPGSGGFARIAQILLNQGNAISRVANNRIIRARPRFALDPNGRFLYVGEGFSPQSLYKLDLTQNDAPIVLEDDHGSVSGTDIMELNGDGSRIYLTSGQVLRTGSFAQAGRVDAGIARFGESQEIVYVAEYAGFNSAQTTEVGVFDTATYLQVDTHVLQCPIDRFARFGDFVVLPQDEGWLVLTQDLVCGLLLEGAREDSDGDGVFDARDNCPDDPNPSQDDADDDGLGDACDAFPEDPNNELAQCGADFDAISLELDECLARPSFLDADADGEHDDTDACPGTAGGAQVDEAGCSLEQFCASHSGVRLACSHGDWLNDEPVGNARDCWARGSAAICSPL
jgi:hypothetical protein